ncbi:FCD domain-containing protein [Nocardia sp. ET3-3]|uniref:FCD domain-containing protein n=1 Tax=Nocardia terrae TaxID=2675851 RepID=A0A7K1VAL3_9NOCA|nr:FCD domain-containing protein [Nocardia terrae]
MYELRIVLEARGIQRLQATPATVPESLTIAAGPPAPVAVIPTGSRGAAVGDPADPDRIPARDTASDRDGIASTGSITWVAPTGPGSDRRPPTRPHDVTAVRHELETWLRIREHPPESGTALIAADEEFHTTLLLSAGNSALADALSTVHARVRPVRALDLPTPGRIAAMADDHIAIAEHLLAGDLDTALRTLLAHLTSSRAHVLTRARRALELTKLAQAVRE